MEREVDILFPDRIPGPSVGWRSAVKRVAMFLVTVDGHRGGLPLRECKASSKGQCRNLVAAPCRVARAVVLSDPSSLRNCVQDRSEDRSAVPQKSSYILGMLSPISSIGPWSPALGKEVGRPHIFLELFSRRESIAFMASRDSAIRQCVCAILECAPYRRRRCLM
jgi:hypothetical protein